jgi:hypothetical protein
MSVRIYSVFVLSCVGSSLATRLITQQGVLATVYKINCSRLILVGKRQESLIRKEEVELSKAVR